MVFILNVRSANAFHRALKHSEGSGLRVRGAEEGLNVRSNSARGRARSSSPPLARRPSTSHYSPQEERGWSTVRKPSPPHRVYRDGPSRSPVPSKWNSYQPNLHEPHAPTPELYRGRGSIRRSRGRRGGSGRGGSIARASRYSAGGNGYLTDLRKGGK
jgi:hypothetical protein